MTLRENSRKAGKSCRPVDDGSLAGVSSRYVGRVGALAIALGVGMALGGSAGSAMATPGTVSNDDDSAADTAEHPVQAPLGQESAQADPDDVTAPPDSRPETGPTSQPTITVGGSDTPTVTIGGSGGANTTINGQPTTVDLDDVGADDSDTPSDDTPTAAPKTTDPDTATRAAEKNDNDHHSPSSAAPRDSLAVAADISEVIRTLSHDITSRPTALPMAAKLRVTSASPAAAQPSTAAIAASPAPAAPAVAAGVVTHLMSALLAPLLAPSPGAPTAPALMFVVLAWVRRELDPVSSRASSAVPAEASTTQAEPIQPQARVLSALVEDPNLAPTLTTLQIKPPDPGTGVVSVNVIASDPDKDKLTRVITTAPTKGTVTLTAAGLKYTPTDAARHAAAAVNATAADKQDTIVLTVSDGRGGTLDIPMTVTISPKNAAPTDAVVHLEDPNPATGVVSGMVTATDPDTDTLTYRGSTMNPKGALVVNSDGTFTYTPTNPSVLTQDVVTITVDDGHGKTLAVPVSLTIEPIAANEDPTASDPTVHAAHPTTGVVTGDLNVSDPNGDDLTYTVTDGPAHGTVVFDDDGNFTYTPNAEDRLDAYATPGADTDGFTVKVTDGRGGFTTVTVSDLPVTPGSSASLPIPVQNGVGNKPVFVAFNTNGSRAYVANQGSGTISVIDTATSQVVATIEMGANSRPGYVTRGPDGKIYVSLSGDGNLAGSVKVIDAASNAIVAEIQVGNEPIGIAFGPNHTAYVANRASDTISVINTTTHAVVRTIAVAGGPTQVAVTPDGEELYVARQYANQLTVLDIGDDYSEVATVQMGSYPTVIAFNADGSRAYVTNQFSNAVYVVDTSTYQVVPPPLYYNPNSPGIPVGPTPIGIALSQDGTRAYVANFSGYGPNDTAPGSVSVVDLDSGKVLETIPVGGGPVGATLSPDGTRLYVANSDGTITVIAVKSQYENKAVTDTVDVGSYGTSVVVSPDGKYAYASSAGTGTVTVIDTATGAVVGDPISVGTYESFSTEVAVSPDGDFVYVVNTNDGTIAVIDTATNTLVDTDVSTEAVDPITIDPNDNLLDVAFNADGTKAFAISQFGGVHVIDTSTHTVVDDIPVNGAYKIAVSPVDGRVYVTHASGGVTIIDPVTHGYSELIGAPGVLNTEALVFSPDGSRAYLGIPGNGSIYAFDAATDSVVGTISTGASNGLAVSPDGTRVYVINSQEDFIAVIDTSTNTVIDTIPTEDYPSSVAVGQDGTVYVTNYGPEGHVSVLSPAGPETIPPIAL